MAPAGIRSTYLIFNQDNDERGRTPFTFSYAAKSAMGSFWAKLGKILEKVAGPGPVGRMNGTIALLVIAGIVLIPFCPSEFRGWLTLFLLALVGALIYRLMLMSEKAEGLGMVEGRDVIKVLQEQRTSKTIDLKVEPPQANTAAPTLARIEGNSTAIGYSKDNQP